MRGRLHHGLRQPRSGLARRRDPPRARRRGCGHRRPFEQAYDACRSMGRTKRRLGRLGPRAHPRVRGGAAASSRSPSPSTGDSTCASSSRAWPTGCTPRRCRTPATTSSSASTAPTPTSCWPTLAEATAAINDAPLDDLEIEDEVFTADRVRAYERAQLDSGYRFYRIIARHRATGEIAGLTVVTVDSENPCVGRPAGHLRRPRAPRSPARPAAEGRHDALARRGRAAAGDRSTPGTPSPTTT